MDTIPQDDFFNDNNSRYLDMPVSPIHPEAIAKLIKEIHGSIQPRMPSNRGPRSEKLFDVVSKARSNPNISILPEKLGWHGVPKDEFKLQFFSNKDTREKLITAYNGLKAKKHPKPASKSKELDLFEEIPDDLKFYDECYLKMANLANVEGLEKLFEPNFALNAYYFVTISDSPGYACYILNYCIKNLSSHIPVGWLLPASENKRELDTTKFCECADIPEGDMEMNVRIGETFDFKDEESFKQWADEVLQGTENEEGVSLVLSAFTSKQRTLQLKEKEMQKHIFKAILAASYVLADNGHLIIKLYTVFQRMSIELMFLLFALFEDFRIVKPNSSHPKKLERFAICSKFRQSMAKDLRENLLAMLPHVTSDEFMKQDGSIIDLNTVMAAKDFNKFIDAMNTTTMQKLKTELDNPRPRKIDARQTKRLLGKWKLIQVSESDQSDEGSPPRGGPRNYQGNQSHHPRQYGGDHRGGYRDNYRDNRNNNYHRDRDDRSNDRGGDRRDYRDNRDNRDRDHRPRGGGDRGGRGGRGRGGYDRDRHGDRDNRRHHHDSRDSRDRDRDRDRSRDYGRDRNDNKRPPDFEKIEVRAKDVLNKELNISSFDVYGLLGMKK